MPNEQEPVLQNANDVSTIISDIQYPVLRSVRQSTGRDRTDDEGTWTDTVNREECDDRMTRGGWLADTEKGENTIIMKLNISSISNHKNTVIWTYLSVIPCMMDLPLKYMFVIILQTNKLDSI